MRERVTRLSSYAILRRDGKILLCRLSIATTSPGRWTLPGGGMEFGESPEDAVKREVWEETGLTVTNLALQKILNEVELFNGKDFHLLRFVYSGEVEAGELRTEKNGTTDLCKWIDETKLETIPVVSLVRKALTSV